MEPLSSSHDEDSTTHVIMEVLESIINYMEEVEAWEYSQAHAAKNTIVNQSEYEFQYEPGEVVETQPEPVLKSPAQAFGREAALTVQRDIPLVTRKSRTIKHYSQAIVDSLVKEACRRINHIDDVGIQ